MVLIYVVYSRRRESTVRYAGPDDDVRENIINYEDEGGGEDDMTAYDITPLQIPIGGPGLTMGLGYDLKGGKIPCKSPAIHFTGRHSKWRLWWTFLEISGSRGNFGGILKIS